MWARTDPHPPHAKDWPVSVELALPLEQRTGTSAAEPFPHTPFLVHLPCPACLGIRRLNEEKRRRGSSEQQALRGPSGPLGASFQPG